MLNHADNFTLNHKSLQWQFTHMTDDIAVKKSNFFEALHVFLANLD